MRERMPVNERTSDMDAEFLTDAPFFNCGAKICIIDGSSCGRGDLSFYQTTKGIAVCLTRDPDSLELPIGFHVEPNAYVRVTNDCVVYSGNIRMSGKECPRTITITPEDPENLGNIFECISDGTIIYSEEPNEELFYDNTQINEAHCSAPNPLQEIQQNGTDDSEQLTFCTAQQNGDETYNFEPDQLNDDGARSTESTVYHDAPHNGHERKDSEPLKCSNATAQFNDDDDEALNLDAYTLTNNWGRPNVRYHNGYETQNSGQRGQSVTSEQSSILEDHKEIFGHSNGTRGFGRMGRTPSPRGLVEDELCVQLSKVSTATTESHQLDLANIVQAFDRNSATNSLPEKVDDYSDVDEEDVEDYVFHATVSRFGDEVQFRGDLIIRQTPDEMFVIMANGDDELLLRFSVVKDCDVDLNIDFVEYNGPAEYNGSEGMMEICIAGDDVYSSEEIYRILNGGKKNAVAVARAEEMTNALMMDA